jgi:diguanylate cyclase (GGDEF)-like protein
MLGSVKNIDERKNYEENLYRLAYYDLLTGLTNRKFFLKELDNILDQGETCSILYIDIDDFKKINEVRGHDFGDELLKFASYLLRSIVGENNLISRAGGDEFLILLNNINDNNDITLICEKILSKFKVPFDINGKSIHTSLSIGVSKYPCDGKDTNSLLMRADIAMYKAKSNGKNNYAVFDKAMGDELIRKVEIERYLRHADFTKEFDIYYQPQVNINEDRLIGLEALIRWTNKELGRVSPAEFIPIAEETGLIEMIGDWVLERVCDDCKKWLGAGYSFNRISVNISAKQLQSREFFNKVNEIISDKGIKAEYIKFEITESALINEFDDNIQVINSFIDMGIQFALDDFGTGNSSINYLRKLPFNTLKIDKTFIDDIEVSELDRAIIKELINLSKDLNVDVIVEGVELEGQVEVLKQIGCTQIQGYYFSKPLPVELTEELLKKSV